MQVSNFLRSIPSKDLFYAYSPLLRPTSGFSRLSLLSETEAADTETTWPPLFRLRLGKCFID